MIFDTVSIATLDEAAKRYLSYKEDPISVQALHTIADKLHDSTKWESICEKAEDILIENMTPILSQAPNDEQAMKFHVIMMGLLAIGFVAGYEAGFQMNVDQTVEKIGGLA